MPSVGPSGHPQIHGVHTHTDPHVYRSTRIHTQKYLSYFLKKRQGKHQIVRQLLSKPSILVSGPLYFLQVGGTHSEITIGSPAW